MKWSLTKNIAVIILISVVLLFIIQAYFMGEVNQTAKGQALTHAQDTVLQIEESLNAMFKNVTYCAIYMAENRMTRNYLSQTDQLERFEMEKYLRDTCTTVLTLNSHILNIILMDVDGQLCFSSSNVGYNAFDAAKDHILRPKEKQESRFFLIQTQFRQYLACYVAVRSPERSGAIGHLAMLLDIDKAAKPLQELHSDGPVDLFLLGPGDYLLATNASGGLADQKSNYTRIVRDLWAPGYRIVGQINDEWISDQYAFFKTSTLLIAGVMAILLAMMGLVINKIIALPIQRLIAQVNQIGADGEKRSIAGTFGVQINPLAQNINAMLANITRLSHQVLENQKKIYVQALLRRESDLYALRNQINPHFIFNSLQCMSGIAVMHGEFEVARISGAMADIFYYALKDGDNVTVQDEISVLTKYLEIMNVRMPDKFNWEIDLPPHIQALTLPKMLLQPLVENAISHGIEKRVEPAGGAVRFSAREEDGYLLFTVSDNGTISEQAIDALRILFSDVENLYHQSRRNKGIGLANIQYRVQIIYGKDCGLEIQRQGGRTIISLRIRPSIPSVDAHELPAGTAL